MPAEGQEVWLPISAAVTRGESLGATRDAAQNAVARPAARPAARLAARPAGVLASPPLQKF